MKHKLFIYILYFLAVYSLKKVTLIKNRKYFINICCKNKLIIYKRMDEFYSFLIELNTLLCIKFIRNRFK